MSSGDTVSQLTFCNADKAENQQIKMIHVYTSGGFQTQTSQQLAWMRMIIMLWPPLISPLIASM